MSKVYMEYAWDMRGYSPCDPCAAPVPDAVDLFTLGARWHYPQYASASAADLKTATFRPAQPDAYLTRLHVRYDAQHFPEDLGFIETSDREPFQAIYKLTHPAATVGTCAKGVAYRKALPLRFEAEARNLAHLTGWREAEVLAKMAASGETAAAPAK